MVRHPLLPYGTKCVGQRMSLLQIKLFLLSFVAFFDMATEEAIPKFDVKQYGQEIVPPVADITLRIRKRTAAVLVTGVSDF